MEPYFWELPMCSVGVEESHEGGGPVGNDFGVQVRAMHCQYGNLNL